MESLVLDLAKLYTYRRLTIERKLVNLDINDINDKIECYEEKIADCTE